MEKPPSYCALLADRDAFDSARANDLSCDAAEAALRELAKVRNVYGSQQWVGTALPIASDDVGAKVTADEAWTGWRNAERGGGGHSRCQWDHIWRDTLDGGKGALKPIADARATWLHPCNGFLKPPCPRCGGECEMRTSGAVQGRESTVYLSGERFTVPATPLQCSSPDCQAWVLGKEGHPLLVHAGAWTFLGLDILAITFKMAATLRLNERGFTEVLDLMYSAERDTGRCRC